MTNATTAPLKKGEIEKRIWGHRLYDEQTGMMTLLEFLCVLENHPFSSQLADPSEPITANNARLRTYEAPKRPLLRSLIFNNPYIDEIYANTPEPWETWRDHFVEDEQNKDIDKNGALSCLRDRLEEFRGNFDDNGHLTEHESFEHFAKIIRLIRYSGINLQSGKRWTSRFVFPWGKHCLYLDMSIKGATSDRRFFARNGELLYMMLCFAQKREELAALLKKRLFESDNDLDAICEMLSFGRDDRHEVSNNTGEGCILPVEFFEESRRRINILCEDLIRIFELPIPTPDIIKHAVQLISLNFLCYFLEQSRAAIKKYSPEGTSVLPCILLCEALQKPISDIRRVSQRFFEVNKDLSLNAVRAYYEYFAGAATGEGIQNDDGEASFDDFDDAEQPVNDKLSDILDTHQGHWGPSLHRFLAKDCGLATNLCTKSYRYAPSDELIETLAAVIVPVERKRLLFSDFLRIAYERYGLVFGEQEFRETGITDSSLVPNNSEFEANRFRLQEKFRSLGLLIALSDGFEFVLNPYQA